MNARFLLLGMASMLAAFSVSAAPVQGDLCTAASATPVNPFTASSTTVGAVNNYDIATTCGVAQTLFAGTGASLDVAYSVVTDANCSVTVAADPTGTNWDLALYVLNAPAAACTQLPALADPQCITMDDDGASNATETVTWSAVAGTEYFVIVDGFNAANGTFDLTITGTGCNLVGPNLGTNADVSITKTDGQTTDIAGTTTSYTIVASNAGPQATAATVADTLPAILTGATWTCAGAGGGTCTAAGSGNINDAVNLPSGGSVTYTVNATIAASATGTVSNTATVAVPGTTTDPNPANNSATDSTTLGAEADLAITVTDGVGSVTPGGSVTYTITASNAGPSNAPTSTVADTFPAALTCTWTCVGAGGGTCTAAGSGNINDSVALPAGGSVTYTASCSISGAASGSLANTATVSSTTTDPNPANNSATDTDTIVPAGALTITPTALNFGSVGIGSSSAALSVTIGNSGGASISVTTLTAPTPPFARTGGSCGGMPISFAGGTSCTLEYTFMPTVSGAANQVLNVDAGAGGSGTITLDGTGTLGVVGVLNANIDFGALFVGANATSTLTITNTGSGPVQVNTISAVVAPFEQLTTGTCGATPFSIPAGASCTVDYRFQPATEGAFNQNVTVTADVGAVSATLIGTGIGGSVIPVPIDRSAMLVLLILIAGGSMVVLRRRG